MTIKLIDKPECPFCWKLRLAMRESGIDFQRIDHDSANARQQIKKLAYGGTFPVLFDGDITITDSSIALAHLMDADANELLPNTPKLRAKARTMEHFASFEMGKAMRAIVLERRDKPAGDQNQQIIAAGEALWLEFQAYLTKQLGDGEFFAERLSMAECALVPRFALAERYGSPVDPGNIRLSDWFARMKQRPSFAASQPWPASS